MSIDIENPAGLAPGLRPGERMVAGRPYIADLDQLNAYLADCEIAAAPEDLSGLNTDQLTRLLSACLNRRLRGRPDPAVEAISQRACDEAAARDERAPYRRPARPEAGA